MGGISDILTDLLSGLFYGPFYSLAYLVWNWCMGMCTGIMGSTPEDFSPTAWSYVQNDLYPWAIGIGASLMNLFFLIGFCRAVSNFKENITLELCVESMIRLVVLNILLQMGFNLIRTFFRIASALSVQLMRMEHLAFYTSDADVGAHLFWWLFGLLYFLVACVTGIMIVLTVYGRYVKLYLLIVFFPLAMPSLAAGRGVDATAYAWVKSFLSNVFEIVVIALVLSISSMLIEGFPLIDVPVLDWFDGFGSAIRSLLSMILMTGAVKAATTYLKEAFAL